MTESFLEDPTLPLFADRQVSYHIIQPHGENGEYPDSGPETVSLSVEDIGQVEDPRLREALHEKFLLEEANPNRSIFIMAKPDGTFSHAYQVPTKPLSLRFTTSGIEELDPAPPVHIHERSTSTPHPKSSRLGKIFGWLLR